ncbi:MAG: hypothetical protein JST19_21960 [Bacteroidetes bacterium]|nr:hypothetical protein [Bacteroidota bacterium]
MKSDKGNREWINDYMSLKQVNPDNPFTVPEGYFDNLEEKIWSNITLEELKENIPHTGFTVPEGYFDELSGNIQARINIEEAADKDHSGFIVPDSYFDELPALIQSRIFVEDTLDGQSESFSVPEGYFENLTEKILNKTAADEKQDQRGVVRRLFSSVAVKYAMAACVILAIGGTIFLSENNSDPVEQHKNSFLHKSLASVPLDDIQSYLQLHLDANDDTHALMDEAKPADADNLSNDLKNALDSTSQ